ncbi:MAG: energy transducer TonB, partial [Limisphaerales bacterium]
THTKKNPRRASAPANQRTTPRPQARRPTVALNQETLKVGQGSPVQGIQTVTGSMRGNYARTVQAAYDKRWIQPSGLSDRQLRVQVEVIIALNGSVQSARILKVSGNRALDQSIQALLDRVKKMPERPPSGSSVDDRTVVLNFNIK